MIEAMIVLGVLTIIVSLAYPSYTRYVIRANRSEAIEALLAAAACQERLFIRNNAYNANQCGGATSNGLYAITVGTTNSNQNFAMKATPQGSQVGDECGTLTLDDRGIKQANATGGDFAITCWAGKFATPPSS